MNDFDDDDDFPDEADDSVEAQIWQLLGLINPGDEDTALRQFTAWRDVQAESDDSADPVETLGEVIDWTSGFRADDPATLVQALNELVTRWNLDVDWGGDPDDDEFFGEQELPDLLATAYDRLLEHGYTVWIHESPAAAVAGWITLSRDAEPMRELATALGINLQLARDAA